MRLSRSHIALGGGLLGVLVASGLLVTLAHRGEQSRREAEFRRRARIQVEQVRSEIERIEGELDALYRLFEAAPSLDR